MPTFHELSQRLGQARHRKAILLQLIEYIDEQFCPKGGQAPRKTLLTEEKLPVPVEMFEAVSSDTLTAEVEQLDQEISQILATQVGGKKTKKEEKESAS